MKNRFMWVVGLMLVVAIIPAVIAGLGLAVVRILSEVAVAYFVIAAITGKWKLW
jgi:hypothetical protein